MDTSNSGWLTVGLTGQTIFSARFVLQWIYSEYKRQSAIPMIFWYASIVGGATLLGYAYRRKVTFQALWPWLPFWFGLR